ncbi:MAG: LAGLIDADG family homing endonuclease, partial [Bacillota bacterium]
WQEEYAKQTEQLEQLKLLIQQQTTNKPSKLSESKIANEWNNKWPKSKVLLKIDGQTLADVRNMILSKSYVLEGEVQSIKEKTDDEKALHLLKKVNKLVAYYGDLKIYSKPELWQFPEITYAMKKGDCIANYEEIYTDNGIKRVGDLEAGDVVLSYDFEIGEMCFRTISKIWEKGEMQIKRVHFRNGQHIDITYNHPLWARTNQQGKSKYKKTYLKDIDLTRWWKRKLPISKKIPYKIRDIAWLNEDLCFVLGHYLAEGWFDKKGKVGSSGYAIIEYIIPLLEKNNIPFTEGKNGVGVPTINFLKSDFKEFLKLQLRNSFDIHIQEDIFHLPENKLSKILEGFYLGDGHNGNYQDKRGFNSNKQEVYSTSSEQLAMDIQRIGLQIGKTFHIWKQKNHKGAGNKPIWRITYNPNSHFLKSNGYKDLSEVSISWIEDLGKTKMRDFEVSGTNTFIFKNGLVSHQCEDGALLLISLMLISGIPSYKVKLCAGYVAVNGKKEGHAYVIYLADDTQWYSLDWCYWYNESIKNFKNVPHKDNINYKEIWWTANNEYTWSQHDTIIEGGK